MKKQILCQNCKYWEEDKYPSYGTGKCRINPPNKQSGFPKTHESDWCGKGKSDD